jgi:plasmid maintenance system antidote protein VapI
VTSKAALRLARHCGASAGCGLNLQEAYELDGAEAAAGERIRAEVVSREAA